MGPRRDLLVFNSGVQVQFLLLLESVLNLRRVTGTLDLLQCLLLDGDILPSAVHLSSVQTQQTSSENLRLMRYRGNFWDIYLQICDSVSLLNKRRVTNKLDLRECLSLGEKFTIVSTSVTRPHQHQIMAILILLNLESDFWVCLLKTQVHCKLQSFQRIIKVALLTILESQRLWECCLAQSNSSYIRQNDVMDKTIKDLLTIKVGS